MKSFFILLAVTLAVQTLPAQPAEDTPGSVPVTNGVSFSPLYVFTNGPGRILPFQDGQPLEVGRIYKIIAFPDRDCEFTNWQPVNVFIFTETTLNMNGTTNPPVTSVVASPVPEYYPDFALKFTNQPVQVLFDVPGVRTVSRAVGWQANFVAITNCDFRRDGHDPRDCDFHQDPERKSER